MTKKYHYGFDTKKDWEYTKDEIETFLVNRIKSQEEAIITYGELMENIKSHTFHAPYHDLFEILGEVSKRTYKNNKVFLSAIVVSKTDYTPGGGFYTMMNEALTGGSGEILISKDSIVRLGFWGKELKKVLAFYKD